MPVTVGQVRSFEADRGLRVRFEAKQPEGIEPGRRRVEADLWQMPRSRNEMALNQREMRTLKRGDERSWHSNEKAPERRVCDLVDWRRRALRNCPTKTKV